MAEDLKLDPKKIEAFLVANPLFIIGIGMVALQVLSKSSKAPAWVKDLPPVNGRVAGPWRGKGSFGHSFGPQAHHT